MDVFLFFQAEDGIRDLTVTGVQTCALPIWVRSLGVAIVVIAASWLALALNGGPAVSNPHLAISVGGGLGLTMLLNTWGVVWRAQKRLIAWSRASAEEGTPMAAEAERPMRWDYL